MPDRDGRVFEQVAVGEWNVRGNSGDKLADARIIVEGVSN
jgi:hypothetical protein